MWLIYEFLLKKDKFQMRNDLTVTLQTTNAIINSDSKQSIFVHYVLWHKIIICIKTSNNY